jgi:hypothetical protein
MTPLEALQSALEFQRGFTPSGRFGSLPSGRSQSADD